VLNVRMNGTFVRFGKVVSGKGGTTELEFDLIVPVYVKALYPQAGV
jgi:hypothetical protein